jgi:hypothetical protein
LSEKARRTRTTSRASFRPSTRNEGSTGDHGGTTDPARTRVQGDDNDQEITLPVF